MLHGAVGWRGHLISYCSGMQLLSLARWVASILAESALESYFGTFSAVHGSTEASQRMYIVAEGVFDVLAQRSDGSYVTLACFVALPG